MIRAVLFDLDGVIIDTERVGHRVAFNWALAELGYGDATWDENLYHELLQTGGGKERIRRYFESYYAGANKPADLDDFVKRAHALKTDIFVQMLPELPLRPGVRRFMTELRERGVPMGICTTSNERVATTVAERILSGIPFSVVLAGDMVTKKKPDPEIYLTALKTLGVPGDECLVVEDSRIGTQAASAAGCHVLATYNGYTADEDLSAAECVVSCLGDADGERSDVRAARYPIVENGEVTAELALRIG